MDARQIREALRSGISIQQLPLRVAFYARVSTEREEQASSLENQIAYYTDFIRSSPAWTFADGYIDDGISGASTLKRDSFNRMINDARLGLFDFIITKEISRFSRNTVDSIQYTQELLRYNVGVLFQNDGINTFEPDGELRLAIMSSLAQDEIRRLSERVKFGHRQCIKSGKVLGSGSLYGYDKKDCRLTVNEEQAETVRLIFDLYANQGLGLRKISRLLYERGITSSKGNPFNTRTMANMLNNPKYKGYYCGNKTSSVDYRAKKSVALPESEWVCHKDENIPAIVPEKLWDRAHALLTSRSAQLRSSGAVFHNRYAYSGKIVCGEHGTSYQRQMRASGKEVWLCRAYRERGVAGCTAPILSTAEINEIMSGVLKNTLLCSDRERIVSRVLELISGPADRKQLEKSAERLKNEISVIEDKKEKLLELSVDGALSNDEFKNRNDILNTRLKKICARLETIRHDQEKGEEMTADIAKIKAALNRELSFKNEGRGELAASMAEKIVVMNTGAKDRVKLEIQLATGERILTEYERERASVCSIKSSVITPT